MPTCLVTAFYEIPNESTVTRYIEQAMDFLKIDMPILLFTAPETAHLFRRLRSESFRIIEKSFSEIVTWKLYGSYWEKKYGGSPLKKLYALRCAKPFLLAEAVAANPFSSTQFLWCNLSVNAVRMRELPTDRVVFGSRGDATYAMLSYHLDGIYGTLDAPPLLYTDVWGGTADALRAWLPMYEYALILYLNSARPLANDAGVMFTAAIGNALISRGRLTDSLDICENTSVRPCAERSPACVVMLGGLGNQMFQLAGAYAYARQHNLRLCVLRNKESYDRRPMYWGSVLSRWAPFLVDSLPNTPIWHETTATHYTVVPKPTSLGLRLCTYLQSPKYFVCDEMRNEIRTMMQPSAEVMREIQDRYASLLAMRGRVVVMHARRGDYCSDGGIFHGPLETDYYVKATEKMCEYVKQPHYLLCSDDAEYWRESVPKIPLLAAADYTILGEESDVNTLALLQQFSHFVIANSSFSWWSAWLAADEKKVIAPNRWFGPAGPAAQFYQDIYDEGWVKC